MSIGQRIVWARKRKGISQERLAEMIGTSRRHMIRIETGRVARPGDKFINRIAEATDQEPGFFTNGTTAADDDEDDSSMPLTQDDFEMLGALMARLGATLLSPARNPVA